LLLQIVKTGLSNRLQMQVDPVELALVKDTERSDRWGRISNERTGKE
jgi:hypothetical protein